MRTLLFTGPGGAGTSTLAAATAVRAARSGRRTLLLTRQPPAVTGLGEVPGLDVVPAQAQGTVEALWSAHAGALADVVPGLTVPPATSVVPLPGTADLALLAEVTRAEADLVVVDAGPLEAATALVGLPATLRWWLDQALPTRLRMLGAVRTAAVRSGTVRRGPVDAVLALVPLLEGLLRRQRLTDPRATEIRLVAVPRPGAVAALRTAVTALGLHGQRPAAVLARVLPEGGAGEWWARRGAEQRAGLAQLADLARLHPVPEAPEAPADAEAAAALLPSVDGGGAAPELPEPATERIPGGWRLALPLPFAVRGEVEVTRWDDDLVVTVAGARRSLRLDSLLRRCVVTAGALADPGTARARLEVTFAPDPQQWPADLLAAEGTGP
ncbi:MAG TPA: ArsA-related P-loop ATPase [Geodermatophilus sp.]|nr:ArsA-related P-loop ATPase [Geodermatophilus sp.]